MRKEYIYHSFERFWHWAQSILILFLIVTGFEIHSSFSFFGFEQAVRLHSIAANAFLLLIAFAIFWHITTGEWRQYLPTADNMRAQIEYYLFGIFRNAEHPTKKSALSKLNPLQKVVYASLKVIIIPVMIVSGLLFMYYRFPQGNQIIGLKIESLKAIAILHTTAAYLLVAFVIAHVYLITTGHSLTSNLKAMITGYEEIPDSNRIPTKGIQQ